ncbi:MAG TPA: hypothetical protein VK666_30200 [Chryseolinea sp.]|nr:hypothetical protein [Chryseolinea sp.]
MTQITVEQQIEAIKKVTAEALKSKESARQFLIDAGIIEDKKPKKSALGKKKK